MWMGLPDQTGSVQGHPRVAAGQAELRQQPRVERSDNYSGEPARPQPFAWRLRVGPGLTTLQPRTHSWEPPPKLAAAAWAQPPLHASVCTRGPGGALRVPAEPHMKRTAQESETKSFREQRWVTVLQSVALTLPRCPGAHFCGRKHSVATLIKCSPYSRTNISEKAAALKAQLEVFGFQGRIPGTDGAPTLPARCPRAMPGPRG